MSDSTKRSLCAVGAMYRNAFRGTAIGYPAEAVRCDAIAGWMRRQGVTVDVTGVDELDWAVVAGIRPSHIVMHGFDEGSGAIALDYGVGRVIVDSAEQVAMLRASATRPQGILLDITDACLDDPATVDRRVWLDGLHYQADGADIAGLSENLFGMVAEMALISRKRAAVLSRLSVGDVDLTNCDGDPRSLRRAAGTIDEVVEEACVRFRYPRPALTVSPRPSTLMPAA
jgi:diaminopimelate decarboxylase